MQATLNPLESHRGRDSFVMLTIAVAVTAAVTAAAMSFVGRPAHAVAAPPVAATPTRLLGVAEPLLAGMAGPVRSDASVPAASEVFKAAPGSADEPTATF